MGRIGVSVGGMASPHDVSLAGSWSSCWALAHERSCEADLAAALVEPMEPGGVPDLAPLRARVAPIAARLPVVAVNLPSIASYDVLVLAMVATATSRQLEPPSPTSTTLCVV